jgi:hypothetical protein
MATPNRHVDLKWGLFRLSSQGNRRKALILLLGCGIIIHFFYFLLGWVVQSYANLPDDDGEVTPWFQTYYDKWLCFSISTAATKEDTAPNNIEARVGATAAINTIREDDQMALLCFTNFIPDESRPGRYQDPYNAVHVVYWVRPIKAKTPHIIGVVWTQTGEKVVFYAQCGPP